MFRSLRPTVIRTFPWVAGGILNAEDAEVFAKAAKVFASAFLRTNLGVLCVESTGANRVAITPRRMASYICP